MAKQKTGWGNIHIVLQHTDRSLLAADLSDILEILGLEDWRESWLLERGVWQVTLNNTNNWTDDA